MYRLVHVEADAAAHAAVVAALADSPLPYALERLADPAGLAPPFAPGTVDALLLGARDQAAALAGIARCRRWLPSQPLIVLTDAADLVFARTALRAGAQDVVQRHARSLAVLSRILLYAIERAGAEARSRTLEAELAGLRATLDAVLATTSEAILKTDAAGTIDRATPPAAALVDLDLPLAPGIRLAERVAPAERQRLQTWLATPGAIAPTTFSFRGPGGNRLLELQPLPMPQRLSGVARLLRIAELAADFAPAPASAIAPAPAPAGGTAIATALATDDADAGSTAAQWRSQTQPAVVPAGTRPGPAIACVQPPDEAPAGGEAPIPAEPVPGQAVEAAPAAGPTSSPLVQIRALATAARWRANTATGPGETLGFLRTDPAAAEILTRVTAAAREDFDVALALDSLRVKGWQDVAADAGGGLPDRLLLEVSYGTVASRPHFDRLLTELATLPGDLAKRFLLVLQGVPKGIYVPTLGKTIRAMGASHGKPALQLPDLDTDYRNLVLGHLGLLVFVLADLKRALARDARQVAAFLARARGDGCRTIVRGATGPLAEALRTRLGIDLTVEA